MKLMSCPDPKCESHERASFCDIFCRRCGKSLVESIPKLADNFGCPKCNVSVFPSDNFCGACGNEIPPVYFLFVFKNPIIIRCIVLTDKEEKAWLALARSKGLSIESAKREFSLVIKLELPNLVVKKGE